MDRLTYDFCVNGDHCWQVLGADNKVCAEVCCEQELCRDCPIGRAIDKLAAYEDTGLEPEEIRTAVGLKMGECRWCNDEICVNADCPMCCDYCPVPDTEGVCRYEDRGDNGRMKRRTNESG